MIITLAYDRPVSLADLTSLEAVLDAIAEYDTLGQDRFLSQYGFGPARRYWLVHNGRRYDSKAIVAAAHSFQFPERGPLRSPSSAGAMRRRASSARPDLRVKRRRHRFGRRRS